MGEGAPAQLPEQPQDPLAAQVESAFTGSDEREMQDLDLKAIARRVQAEFDELHAPANREMDRVEESYTQEMVELGNAATAATVGNDTPAAPAGKFDGIGFGPLVRNMDAKFQSTLESGATPEGPADQNHESRDPFVASIMKDAVDAIGTGEGLPTSPENDGSQPVAADPELARVVDEIFLPPHPNNNEKPGGAA